MGWRWGIETSECGGRINNIKAGLRRIDRGGMDWRVKVWAPPHLISGLILVVQHRCRYVWRGVMW